MPKSHNSRVRKQEADRTVIVCRLPIHYTCDQTYSLAACRVKQPSRSTEPELTQPPKKASLLHVVRIVISLLFMIGRNRDYGPQAPVITPARLIIVSVVGAVLLVTALIMLASFIAH